MFVGGFASIRARHAMPDVGLMGLADISAVVRDVRAATTLPMMVDADDGYGDAKNVAHTVRTYERLGVQAIFMKTRFRRSAAATSPGRQSFPRSA